MGFEIPKSKNLQEQVFSITNEKEFTRIALAIFHYQFLNNYFYQAYCNAIHRQPETVKSIGQIPFLPIQFFKTKNIQVENFEPEIVFKSSGTTGSATSRHLVKSLPLYENSFLECFEIFYGKPEDYCILGLLPSYLEKGDSSLVYMVDFLIKRSGHSLSGFYLYDHSQLKKTLLDLEGQGQKTILFGVSYALLDFAEAFPTPLHHTTIIETGGMKGRKKELTKTELYAQLQKAFSLTEIQSEYGMTELLSQAYAINGIYKTPPWMKILLREEADPFSFSNRSGVINVIDLANIYSCSFIATDDLGRLHSDGSFEVLGRLDNSDVRGCSQLLL
jgi:hypothetical protein